MPDSRQQTPAHGDELFYQFVQNVQDHAIFAMDPQGRILHWNAGAARIMGFDASDVDNAESRAGMGIGLALARELVELHGGTIQARSDGVGKGSEFIVRLPLHSPLRD